MKKSTEYFQNTWISGNFPLKTWNHYENKGPRTNYALEGWQGRINRFAMKQHLNIFEFIELIKSEENASEFLITQLQTRGAPAKRRKTYRKVDKKLDHLKEKFQNNKTGMYDYLKAVGYLFAQWG